MAFEHLKVKKPEPRVLDRAPKPKKAPKPRKIIEIARFACGHEKRAEHLGKCPGCKQADLEAQYALLRDGLGTPIIGAGRLPHCSSFIIVYHAEQEQWAGTLNVPGFPLFDGVAGGSERLLQTLKQKYRKMACIAKPETVDSVPVEEAEPAKIA